jgi:hypothetical protein
MIWEPYKLSATPLNEIWVPEKPLSTLPVEIRVYYVEQADYLHDDLMNNRLTVTLIPAPDPRHTHHMIRVAVSHNPEWYSELY